MTDRLAGEPYGLTVPFRPVPNGGAPERRRPHRSWVPVLLRAAADPTAPCRVPPPACDRWGQGVPQSSGRTPVALVPREPEVRVKATRWPSWSSR